MRLLSTCLFFLFTLLSFSQPETEIFLFDLNQNNDKIELSNFKNISNNQGYDNQPSFLDNNTILYAGTRNNQTDIVMYNLTNGSKTWVCATEGGEYSPLKIPNQEAVSAIRLDPDGKQLLYRYDLKNRQNPVPIDTLVIGYHNWFTPHIIISSVLEDDFLTLYKTNIKAKKNDKLQQHIGRSLHNIPNSKLVSYISKENDRLWEIKSLDPISGTTQTITNTLPETEDMCWLPDGSILMAKADILYRYQPEKNKSWEKVTSLKSYGISNMTRITVSPEGKKLALVGELNTQKLEPKLENIAWISGHWKGEAFGGLTEENWSTPSAGSMMATFKLINDNKVTFYEIEIIRELENTLMLQLKHFNNDLKGWETKDETINFPLKEITATKVIFEGMTFEKISDTEMNVYVDIHQEDGSIETVKFNYNK